MRLPGRGGVRLRWRRWWLGWLGRGWGWDRAVLGILWPLIFRCVRKEGSLMKRQLCFVTAITVAQVVGLAQAPTLTAPPIKMGLWQTTTTSTMSGITLPPEVVARLQAAGRPVPGSQPHTTVTQSCA